SEHCPFVHWLRAERTIKLNGRLVPIEHSPFHPAAAAVPRDFRKLDEQCAPITFAPLFWFYEQVFQVKPRPPKPGGKIIKENCEPNGRFSFKRKKHLRSRPFPEQHIDELLLCRGHLIRCTLVRRQIANQLQNDWHVFHAGRTNSKIIALRHYAADSPPRANGRNWVRLSVILNFFPKKDGLDISFTAQLASGSPLSGYAKANSVFP